MKTINETPYTVKVYASSAHWDNIPVFEESYPDKQTAEKSIKLISAINPKYCIELLED